MSARSWGPYQTRRQLAKDCRELYDAARVQDAAGALTEQRRQRLLGALREAGVVLGAEDLRQVQWLASKDVETVQVIAGWIRRANEEEESGG